MARIPREQSQQKQTFVLGLLATNPALTVREVQEQLKTQFGATMNPAKVLALRRSLTGEATTVTVTPVVQVVAPQPIAVEPTEPTEVTEVNTVVMDQVTTSQGVSMRPHVGQDATKTEVQLVKGLVEVL